MNGYWGEHYYGEVISQKWTVALGRVFAANPLPETATHPGLFQARYDSVATDSLLARPRLQNYAAKGIQYSRDVEHVTG